MADTADKVINIALTQVGYLEKKTNSQLNIKTANAGDANYTKYGRDMGCNGQPWCDAFNDWCFVQAYGRTKAQKMLGGFSNYTPTSTQYYKNMGRWYTSNPKPGDQIFFKNSIRICHTGLVYKVDTTRVYTIEGNTSGTGGVIANGGGVCKKSYLLSHPGIAGYGRPAYDITSASNPLITAGLQYAKNFTGADDMKNITRAKGRVLQRGLNLDYGKTITEDGEIGAKSRAKLGSHYVASGEKQYMVTAAEILMYLNGINPAGVELPGIYGAGLTKAAKTRFGGTGRKITASNFLTLIQ